MKTAMKYEEAQRKQELLEDCLRELSTNTYENTELEPFTKRLASIYMDGFRHEYSSFFPLVIEISREDNEFNLEYLMTNLISLRSIVGEAVQKDEESSQESQDLYESLTKLWDHMNLEIARHNYNSSREERFKDLETKNAQLKSEVDSTMAKLNEVETGMINLQEKNVQLNAELGSSTQKLTEIEIRMQNLQRDYVAILGIFAAVVIAFTGSLVFSSSVLENISESSIYRTVFVSLLIGLVLIDVLFFLFRFIEGIVLNAKAKSIRPLIITNVVIAIMIVATVLVWYFGLVEKRNDRIEPSCAVSAAVVIRCDQD